MADRGDMVVTLPDDDERVTPRNQDQRGNTGRGTNAKKLEEDVETALQKANEKEDRESEFSDTDEDALAKMRRELERTQRRAEAAERRASEAEGQRAEALDGKTQADLNMLKTAKTQLEDQEKILKQQLAQAHADGDFDAIAAINQAMVKNGIDKNSVENGIIALENQPKQREALRRRGQDPSDEGLYQAITKGMDPEAKQWFRDNPEYYRDPEMLERVIAAHKMVMTRRTNRPTPNTPEYFEAVEEMLDDPKFRRGRQSGSSLDDGDDDLEDDALSEASRGARRRGREIDDDPPPPAAPVSRSGRGVGGSDRGAGRQIRLTAEELEMAQASGLTPEQYAANKRALLREERIGPKARSRMH